MTPEEFKKPLVIGGHKLPPGTRKTLKLPIGHLITHEIVDLTVHIRRGKRPGPRLLVSAAIHGDEINGVEAVRNLLSKKMSRMSGDLILIPVANLPAFLSRSRYLPDRRDLNRLFPGSSTGSFGARLARVLTKIAKLCTHGIDLHTGAVTRPNLPQIRFSKEIPEALDLARAFGAPVIIDADVRPGSFRHVFTELEKPQLLFEGGEAGILEPAPARLAAQGVLSVMRQLGMLPQVKMKRRVNPILCVDTYWQRAPRGGLFTPTLDLGEVVTKGATIGRIGDPFGDEQNTILAECEGVIIGRARNAVIDEGDGIFHIGLNDYPERVSRSIRAAEAELDHKLDHPVFDDPLND